MTRAMEAERFAGLSLSTVVIVDWAMPTGGAVSIRQSHNNHQQPSIDNLQSTMLPALPAAAIVLLVGGIVAASSATGCSASSWPSSASFSARWPQRRIFGVSDTGAMIVAAVVGNLLGAGIAICAYFVGGVDWGGPRAVVANLAFAAGDRDPHFLVVFIACRSRGRNVLQRYFIIVGTASAAPGR
jgi:hypothetical protein